MNSGQVVAMVASFVVVVGGIAAISWVVLKLWRGYHNVAGKALGEILRKYTLHTEPGHGRISLRYPTYVGALFTMQETLVQAWMEKQQAKKLLNELFWFNLKRLWPSAFFPYALLLTLFNYVGQSWKLR